MATDRLAHGEASIHLPRRAFPGRPAGELNNGTYPNDVLARSEPPPPGPNPPGLLGVLSTPLEHTPATGHELAGTGPRPGPPAWVTQSAGRDAATAWEQGKPNGTGW